jgi:hypothetical protein
MKRAITSDSGSSALSVKKTTDSTVEDRPTNDPPASINPLTETKSDFDKTLEDNGFDCGVYTGIFAASKVLGGLDYRLLKSIQMPYFQKWIAIFISFRQDQLSWEKKG